MGYEMGFMREGADLDSLTIAEGDVYWFACGWDKVDLYKAMSRLPGAEVADDEGIVVIPLESLVFLEALADDIAGQSIFQVISALGSLDRSYAEEFAASMPIEVRAAMALPFAEGEGATADVRRFLCDKALEGDTWLTVSLGDAVRKARVEGVSHVVMYGG